jgi:ParB family chromosome partitioning protein
MNQRVGGLGRGLGALIPTGTPTGQPGAEAGASGDSSGLAPIEGARFVDLPIDQVRPNRVQPRTAFDADALQELVDSIREVGLLQPVVVRPLGPDSYELVMGERRLRAHRELGRDTIPAIVRETADHDLLRDALLENLHRAALNPLEEAAAYQQLLADFGCTQEELAQRIGRSRPQISNTIRLLQLPPAVQNRVAAGVLSAGHARAILGLPTAAAQEEMAHRVVAEGLSVRSTEELVSLAASDGPAPKERAPRAKRPLPAAVAEVADRLSDRFETRVRVEVSGKGARAKGKLVVEFAGEDDLQRILSLMEPPPAQ